MQDLKEYCANCGRTYGSHHAGQAPWPRDYCPGHEGKMDFENGPGTWFKPSGRYMKTPDRWETGEEDES